MNVNFSNIKIPKNIDSPINDAFIEIRFEGNVPREAIYGLIFQYIENKDQFHQEIEELPTAKINNRFLSKPQFKYEPHYRVFTKDKNFSFSVGSNVVIFGCHKEYKGWEEWDNFFKPVYDFILSKNFIKRIETVTNRCLDIFSSVDIVDVINFDITLFDSKIKDFERFVFSIPFFIEDIKAIVSIQKERNDLILDIGCIQILNKDIIDKDDIFIKTHEMNKKVFFSLIRREYVEAKLNPIWE